MRRLVHRRVIQLKGALKFMFVLIPSSYDYLPAGLAQGDMVWDIHSTKKQRLGYKDKSPRAAGSKGCNKWTGPRFLHVVEAIWLQINYSSPPLGYAVVSKPSISSSLPVSLLPHVDRIHALRDISERSQQIQQTAAHSHEDLSGVGREVANGWQRTHTLRHTLIIKSGGKSVNKILFALNQTQIVSKPGKPVSWEGDTNSWMTRGKGEDDGVIAL